MEMKVMDIFQDGMVIQRDKPVRIWGTGRPGDVVSIDIQGRHSETIVRECGHWECTISPLSVSANETMVIRDSRESVTFSDIAVGEVWVASGQSNMEFQMRFEKHREDEMKNCCYENLRFYDVPEISYDGQTEDFDYSSTAVWRKATKENLDYFSAVGYYFQKELAEALDVPVGIIGCNWGGTCSCTWMKSDSVAKVGESWFDDYKELISSKDMDLYWKEQRTSIFNDRGDLIHDAFTEFMMPRTPSEEEISAFFAELAFAGMPTELLPTQIPGNLFEHMVKKIAPYTVRGILWYQGESDDIEGRQKLYKNMLTALIRDWREEWHDSELPFLIVQLPGFRKWAGGVDCLDYITIRRCQEQVTKEVHNTWLCSISDSGEEYDIHPKDKETVGRRLALLARGNIYGEDILCGAPEVISTEKNEKELILTFSNAAGGLMVKGEKLQALEIYKNGKKINFIFRIDGERLILVPEEPDGNLEILFAQTNWYQVNLYNQAQIPAIPFHIYCED